jgi:hypothetical protein
MFKASYFGVSSVYYTTHGYIDTEGKLSIAIEEIRQAIQKGETIAVDCEGVDLSHFGSVTLINIAVSSFSLRFTCFSFT